jgi:hypothetical protein
MRALKSLFVVLALLLHGLDNAHAERKYTVGTQIDLGAGSTSWSTEGALATGQLPRDLTFFYSVYPSMTLKSEGHNSLFDLSYVYGTNRTNKDLVLDSGSHIASGTFNFRLNPNWRLNLAESFEMTPDFNSLNVMRGVITNPQGFEFLFYPVATRSSSQINNAKVGLEYEISQKSSLSFGAEHTLRNYEENELFLGRLSDQQRFGANIALTRKTSEHSSWAVSYSGAYYDFTEFDNSLIHKMSAAFTHDFSPTLNLRLEAGPSFVEALDAHKNYTGYHASLNLLKQIQPNLLSFYYNRESGEGSGLGSISDTHRGGFGFSRQLGRVTSFSVDISAFESRGRLENPLRARGASGAASIGIALTKTLSVNFTGQYQRYDQVALFGFEEKRFFTSLRFHAPNLWRFAR